MNLLQVKSAAPDTDVFDTHWYPDVPGMSTIRTIHNHLSECNCPALWDSSYKEPTWIGQYFGGVEILKIIHRLSTLIIPILN